MPLNLSHVVEEAIDSIWRDASDRFPPFLGLVIENIIVTNRLRNGDFFFTSTTTDSPTSL